MSSKFHINRRLPGGYIISKTLLEKCVQLADRLSDENRAPNTPPTPTDISVTFKSGREVNSKNLDDVLGDSFIQSTKIDEMVISNGNAFTIRLRRSSAPISFRISGDRSNILAFEHDLLNELSSGKTWYNFNYYEQFSQIVSVICLLSAGSIVSLLVIRFMGGPTLALNNAINADIFVFLVTILILVALPDIIFDFGEGARRRKIRDYALSGIIVASMIGLGVNFFTGWVTGGLPTSVVAPSAAVANQITEVPPPAPFHLPENINEASNQDIRLLAYRLNQILGTMEANYSTQKYNIKHNITGSDDIASAQLSLDDSIDKEFRREYEDSFLKLDEQLANRLKIDDTRYKSFPSGRVSIGDIDFAGAHLLDLANRLQ